MSDDISDNDFIEETDFSDGDGVTLTVRRKTDGVYLILGMDGGYYPAIICNDPEYLHMLAATIDLYACRMEGKENN